jgi:hypothetical protein
MSEQREIVTEKPVKPQEIPLWDAVQNVVAGLGNEPAKECILVWVNEREVKAVAFGHTSMEVKVGMLEVAKFVFLLDGNKGP